MTEPILIRLSSRKTLLLFWLALGTYCVIAAIGGSATCAAIALFSGFMAGRAA